MGSHKYPMDLLWWHSTMHKTISVPQKWTCQTAPLNEWSQKSNSNPSRGKTILTGSYRCKIPQQWLEPLPKTMTRHMGIAMGTGSTANGSTANNAMCTFTMTGFHSQWRILQRWNRHSGLGYQSTHSWEQNYWPIVYTRTQGRPQLFQQQISRDNWHPLYPSFLASNDQQTNLTTGMQWTFGGVKTNKPTNQLKQQNHMWIYWQQPENCYTQASTK